MGAITFDLVADFQSFLWGHECKPLDVSQLDAETADWYLEKRAQPRELPLGDGGWQLVNHDPLTITPSILCGECGLHGFITDGQWVSA